MAVPVDDDFFSDLPSEPLKPEIVPTGPREITLEERRVTELRSIEDRLLVRSLETVEDAARWDEIDEGHNFQEQGYPDKWMEELGDDIERVKRRGRVALAAQLSAKNAPVGLILSQRFALGVIKARATEKVGPRTLNVQFVQMQTTPVTYPALETENDDD